MSGGKIVFVGTNAGAKPWIGPKTRVLDASGKMLLPAFHDAHVHPVSGGVEALECDLNGAPTPAAVLERVKAYAAAHPSAPWIRGGGWELTLFPDANPSKVAPRRDRARSARIPVGDRRPLGLGQLEGAAARGRHEGDAGSALRPDRTGPGDGRADRDAPRGRRRPGFEVPPEAHREGLRRRAPGGPPHREPVRPDVARRSERVGGGPRSLPDPRVPRRAHGARRRVAPLRHGQGPRGGGAPRRPAQEVRRQAPPGERRQDLRRRRPRDADGRGARALPRVPGRSRQGEPRAGGVPRAGDGPRPGRLPDPRPRDRRPCDPDVARRPRGRAQRQRGPGRAPPSRAHRADRARRTSRASGGSASSRTSSRSGPTATST